MEQKNKSEENSRTQPTSSKPAKGEIAQDGKKIPYPKSVFFIVTNEFCERFTFYGMRTVLALYLKNQLNFDDNTATVIYHVFIMFCYFFPLLGAIIADSWLGKYRTILYVSMVYAVGNVVVSVSAIPISGMPAVALTMIGLVLIALGTGGIKPCVSAFGGDQFIVPQQQDHLKKFFSIFYFMINAGSFVSTFLTPILRETPCFGEEDCYCLAFGVPAALMILAIIIYFSGHRFYTIKQPEGNIIVKVSKCVWYAITKKGKKTGGHWMDAAEDKFDKQFISDIKATFRVLFLYIPLPFFWALFDQQGSRWTFQATRMDGDIGSVKIQPDQMQVVNPLLILTFIPFFETVLYPLFAKCNLLKKPLQKLTVGGMLAAVAFGVSALVEHRLESTYAVLPEPNLGQIRIYNGLTNNVTVQLLETDLQPFSIESLGFWTKYDIPVKGEKKLQLQYESNPSDRKTETVTVKENNVTSFILTPKGVITKEDDDADKSKKGNPKLMIIYPDLKGEKIIKVGDCESKKDFTVTEAVPYTDFMELRTCSDYSVEVDGFVALDKIQLKQGGVYVAFISGSEKQLRGKLLNIIQPNSIHMLWLLPQFIIITAGEIMFSITGLEFSFTQAPVSMKSLLQAAWLLTVAAGNLIVVIISEARIFKRQFYEFLLFAGLMALDMLIFALMAMRYKYVEIQPQNETGESEGGSQNPKDKI